jgi:hypothetical protein
MDILKIQDIPALVLTRFLANILRIDLVLKGWFI